MLTELIGLEAWLVVTPGNAKRQGMRHIARNEREVDFRFLFCAIRRQSAGRSFNFGIFGHIIVECLWGHMHARSTPSPYSVAFCVVGNFAAFSLKLPSGFFVTTRGGSFLHIEFLLLSAAQYLVLHPRLRVSGVLRINVVWMLAVGFC
jgi:hypothetical protein